MTTAKKTASKTASKPVAAKKPAAKAKVAPKSQSAPEGQKTYTMPQDVKDWIERAQSIMNHQKGEIERLKKENTELKAYKKWASNRLLSTSYE